MKLVYIADLHLRPTVPINRKDDYVEAQFKKLDFVIDYVNQVEGVLLIGGDVFDRASNHPSWFLNRVMKSFMRCLGDAVVIPGNHDLIGHNLESIELNSISLLSYLQDGTHLCASNSYALYGSSTIRATPFGVTPDIEDLRGVYNKILMLHEPVFEDTVPFYMPDALTVEQLEAKYPGFDMYLAGDIHIPCQKSKTLVSGSMMRMTTIQKEHKPRFYVIDSETLEVETIFIPIVEDVWKDVSEIAENEGFKAELKDLAAAMQERDEGLDYPAVCLRLSGGHWGTFDRLITEYQSKREK